MLLDESGRFLVLITISIPPSNPQLRLGRRRLVGIRGRGPNGSEVEERATITVGADGRNSRLARAVHAPVYNDLPTILCYYFSYWSNVQAETFELYSRDQQRRIIFSFKTEEDLYAVFVGLPIEELHDVRRDIEGAFMRSLELVPEFAERVRAGRREERFYGASDLPNFYRKPFGAAWAQVGDAGLHKDPYMALGICDALRDAELLAHAIEAGLAGRRQIDQALAEYARRRDESSAADFDENVALARFTPVRPEVLAICAAVRERPEDATRFIKARMGMTDPAAFFNPQNLQQLLAGAEPSMT